jgi:hypothetical protein
MARRGRGWDVRRALGQDDDKLDVLPDEVAQAGDDERHGEHVLALGRLADALF